MKWIIKNVEPLDGFKLKLWFEDNEVRIFDMKPYLNHGIFKSLSDEKKFKTVRVSFDTIEWEDNIDIEPEFLYNESLPVRLGN